MSEFNETKLAEMLTKVQGLWAKAEGTDFPAEAEECRRLAQKLMSKYRIDEETLRQTKIASGEAAKPVEVLFTFLIAGSAFTNHYYTLMYAVMNHVGVRGRVEYGSHDPETGKRVYTMNLIGFDSDVRLVELLYMNLRETFTEKVDPKVDPNLSEMDNVYRLRSAGVTRDRIADLLWGRHGGSWSVKATNLYKAACEARGEDPKVVGRSVNAKTYRDSFADAFVSETQSRLRRMKRTAAEEGGVLVLAGRDDAVNEAFYERYPELRPAAVLDSPTKSVREQCSKCQKSKRGACRDHYIATGGYKERPHSSLGWSAGTYAAREADLNRAGARPTSKLEG